MVVGLVLVQVETETLDGRVVFVLAFFLWWREVVQVADRFFFSEILVEEDDKAIVIKLNNEKNHAMEKKKHFSFYFKNCLSFFFCSFLISFKWQTVKNASFFLVNQ